MSRPEYSKREQDSLRLWLALSGCAGRMQRYMDGLLRREHGQSMSRFDVLSQLERADGQRLSIGQLANQLLASSGNITRLLDRMIDDGLVTRETSQLDRRSFDIKLTPQGLAQFYNMARDHAKWAREALCDLTPEEMQKFSQLLSATQNSLEKVF